MVFESGLQRYKRNMFCKRIRLGSCQIATIDIFRYFVPVTANNRITFLQLLFEAKTFICFVKNLNSLVPMKDCCHIRKSSNMQFCEDYLLLPLGLQFLLSGSGCVLTNNISTHQDFSAQRRCNLLLFKASSKLQFKLLPMLTSIMT